MIPNIGLFDVSLGLFYLALIYFIAIKWTHKSAEISINWLLAGLTLKILAGMTFAFLAVFYYQNGDTFLFHGIAQDFLQHMKTHPSESLKAFFTSYDGLDDLSYHPLQKFNYNYDRSSTWSMVKLIFAVHVLSGSSYWVSTLLISVVSFLGYWQGLTTLNKAYPGNFRGLFLLFFAIPSAMIWSSGLLKDSLIMAAFFLLISAGFNIVLKHRKLGVNLSCFVLSALLLFELRPIFLYAFLPFLIIWLVFYMRSKGKIEMKTKAFILIFGLPVIAVVLISVLHSSKLEKYSPDRLFDTLQRTQQFHSSEHFAKGQNTYDLGGIVEGKLDLILKVPKAISTTYFRPFIWEADDLPMTLGALESLVLFIVLLMIIVRAFKRRVFFVGKQYELIIVLIFSLFYSFVVGISSYNFGALSRYKIPAIFMILFFFMVVYNSINTKCPPKKGNA